VLALSLVRKRFLSLRLQQFPEEGDAASDVIYRRALPDEKTRRRLQRLDRRLLDVAAQLDRSTTAQK
jgi:hypothetical protein